MASATASETHAGRVPVEAVAMAPSSPASQEMYSQARSLCSDLALIIAPVRLPKEEPAATPSL